jgi:hypothetical protein
MGRTQRKGGDGMNTVRNIIISLVFWTLFLGAALALRG